MKKLLGIIVLNLFLISNAFGGWLSNSPSIFGVELESNISNYKQKNCLINHNYSNLGLDNFILTQYSTKDTTGPNWSNWIYTNSKLPVSEGCINPKVENDDFFNFHVKIFPKTKEIYEISAIYKKVYKYKGKDLEDNLILKSLTPSDDINLTVRNTQCESMAYEIAGVIVGAQKKEGFKFERNHKFNSELEFIGVKGRGKNKSKLEVSSSCSIKGKGNNNWIKRKDLDNSFPFLVKVSIALEEYSSNKRVEYEENLLEEDMIGNTNPDINTKGLN